MLSGERAMNPNEARSNYVEGMEQALRLIFSSYHWHAKAIEQRRYFVRTLCHDIGYTATDKEQRQLCTIIWDEVCKGILRGQRVDFDKRHVVQWMREGAEIKRRENEDRK